MGLFTNNGEEWWKSRQLINKGMMKANAAAPYLSAQTPVGDELVDVIKKSLQPGNLHPVVMEDVYRFALESICTVIYDRRLGCMDPNLASDSWQQEFINTVKTLNASQFLFLIPKYKLYDKIGYESSAVREYYKSLDYISDLSLRLIVESRKEWEGLPEVELQKKFFPHMDIDEKLTVIVDTLLAALDTMTYTTLFCCFFLAKNPDVQEKLFAEIDENVTDWNAVKFSKLPYLRACIRETDRLKPIVPFNNRQLSCDIVIKGYKIPKGVNVFLEHEYAAKSPRYVQNPDAFNPDRCLRSDRGEASEEKLHPFAVLPFGFGPRMCPGRRFAEQQINIALVKLVANFQLEYDGDHLPLKGIGLDNAPVPVLNFQFNPRV